MAGGGDGPVSRSTSPLLAQFGNSLVPRRHRTEDPNFDITAMIDLVFMMNIFFLVTSLTKSMSEMELPVASYCTAANEEDSVVVSIRSTHDRDTPSVSIAGGSWEDWPPDMHELEQRIQDAVERGVREEKRRVLIKAERKLPLRHVGRLASIVGSVAGAQPLFAVMEMDAQEK
jgi:biopolymer transport protein ExbD